MFIFGFEPPCISCCVCISVDCILVCSVIYYDYNNDTLNNSDH